jgi:hypothetical protein
MPFLADFAKKFSPRHDQRSQQGVSKQRAMAVHIAMGVKVNLRRPGPPARLPGGWRHLPRALLAARPCGTLRHVRHLPLTSVCPSPVWRVDIPHGFCYCVRVNNAMIRQGAMSRDENLGLQS